MLKKNSFLLLILFVVSSCELTNDLNDATERSETVSGNVGSISLLNGAYDGLRNYQSQDQLLALEEITADGLAVVTRGPDWDDAGVWRSLHLHTWTPTLNFINNQWSVMSGNSFAAQNVICNQASGVILAQAIFLRAFNDFLSLDNFGIYQRRECGTDQLSPPNQFKRNVGALELIKEVEEVLENMPTTGEPVTATADAAKALLMKLYLNKAVYAATTISEAGVVEAQEGPYNSDVADMNKVIQYADEIIGNGYTLADSYYDNFSPDNTQSSRELIFVSENTALGAGGNLRSRWLFGTHYNQFPSGWNGFVTLTDLYNLYESGDARVKTDAPSLVENGTGYNAGFLVGQQKNTKGEDLKDRRENPLIFTPNFKLQENGESLELSGIRTVKYLPDYTDVNSQGNDYVIFRLADVMLMKAEAILRGGSSSDSPLDIVNRIRMRSGATSLTNVDLDILLDERHRELWHENWRRNDLIRYNKFLGEWQEKPASTKERLLFPIPSIALSVDPNLVQNFGY